MGGHDRSWVSWSLGILGKPLFNFGTLMVVKGVEDNLVTEPERLSFRDCPSPISFDFFRGKRVGGDQTIVPCMPPSLLVSFRWIGGMTKKSNAGGFAIYNTKVMHPICPFPPDCFGMVALAIEGLSKYFFYSILWAWLKTEVWMGTDGKYSIFVGINLNWTIGGM